MKLFQLIVLGGILGFGSQLKAATDLDLANAEIIADGNAIFIVNTVKNTVQRRIINSLNTGFTDTSSVNFTNVVTSRNWDYSPSSSDDHIVAVHLSIGNLFVVTSDKAGNQTLTALVPNTGFFKWQADL